MEFIRGRCEARWLPSRYNFAIFRLAALVRLSVAMRRPEPVDPRRLFFVDRHQSVFENYAVSLWLTATAGCFLASWLAPSLGLAPAFAVGLPLAAILLEIPVNLSGLLLAPVWSAVFRTPSRDRHRVNGFVLLLVVFIAAVDFAGKPGWAAFAGWQVLALFALNGAAAVAMFAMRGHVAALEKSFGGVPSAS